MYRKYDGWFIQSKIIRNLKEYRRATTKDLKQGSTYYWFNKVTNVITHELQYDVVSPKYIGDLKKQIAKGVIWVKKVQPKKEVKEDKSQMSLF